MRLGVEVVVSECLHQTIDSLLVIPLSITFIARGQKSTRLGECPFKFQAAWLLHEDFMGWMKQEWNGNVSLLEALKQFAKKLKMWNKHTFRNVF